MIPKYNENAADFSTNSVKSLWVYSIISSRIKLWYLKICNIFYRTIPSVLKIYGSKVYVLLKLIFLYWRYITSLNKS